MLEARVQQQFFDSADSLNQSAEGVGRAIGQAVEAVVGCLTAGGKLVVCAQDGAAALGEHVTALFVGRFERVRPPLPALALSNRLDWPGAAVHDADPAAPLVQQIQALCNPGDILLTLSLGHDAPALHAAVRNAQDKDMTIVAFNAAGDVGIRGLLRETDVSVLMPVQRVARVLELHLLALHCLCDAIDTQLLGEQDLA